MQPCFIHINATNTTFFTTIIYHIFVGVVELWIQLFTWIHHFFATTVKYFSNSKKYFEKCCICSISSTLTTKQDSSLFCHHLQSIISVIVKNILKNAVFVAFLALFTTNQAQFTWLNGNNTVTFIFGP